MTDTPKTRWKQEVERSASAKPVDPKIRPAVSAEEITADKLYGKKKDK